MAGVYYFAKARLCKVNNKFLTASYKGKDLLEASGAHAKASLQFKSLMEELSQEKNNSSIEKQIYEFAFFIYGDEKRSKFFMEKIIEELK